MLTRFGLCLVLMSLLSACSSVPDRYAPWRDGDDNPQGGHKPNLADVPMAPNTAAAKSELDTMRQRLEQDRDNAYLAAQGIVPINEPAPVAPVAPVSSSTIFDTELNPPSSNPLLATEMKPAAVGRSAGNTVGRGPIPPTTPAIIPNQNNIASTSLPSPQEEPSVITNSNVMYNYDPSANNEYTYGTTGKASSSVQVNPASELAANSDPSISVDWSALGESPIATSGSAQLAYNGITLGEPVAYFAHGSATLGPKDRAAIRDLARQLKQHPQPVMLAGNSSSRTGLGNTTLSRQINLRMSTKRANAVMAELVRQGIKPDMIYISAYGDSIPNRRSGAGDEAADRRVEVIFDK